MQNMRNFEMDIQTPPQYSIEKADHLENIDDENEYFYSQLRNFNTKTYCKNAPHNVKKSIKSVKRKYANVRHRFLVK